MGRIIHWDVLAPRELRSVRLQLELLKPEMVMQERDVASTIVVFGSSRVPAPEEAEDLSRVSSADSAATDAIAPPAAGRERGNYVHTST